RRSRRGLAPVRREPGLPHEINRSRAKTQSAMVEAMQQQQNEVCGEVHALPRQYLVIATQNPSEQEGTYELPEAQMDRFLLKEIVQYPSPQEEREVLERLDSGVLAPGQHASKVATIAGVSLLQEVAAGIHVSQEVRNYIVGLAYVTRNAA